MSLRNVKVQTRSRDRLIQIINSKPNQTESGGSTWRGWAKRGGIVGYYIPFFDRFVRVK